jgi:hypothetical protein
VIATDASFMLPPGLCILDANSQLAADECGTLPAACPYPACGCKWMVACPSGTNLFNTPAVTGNTPNAVSPYYPDAATCCAAGTDNTIRERLVTAGHLDCSTRPCTATAAGLTQVSISYTSDATITGSMPPQIAALTAVTLVHVFSLANVSGTLPTQLGLMTLVKNVQLYGLAKLSGTIPPQISGMTSMTQL